MGFFIKNMSLLTLTAVLGLAIFAPNAWALLTTQVNHEDIQINLNYHGSSAIISGKSDSGVDLIVKIYSEDGQEKLMKKGSVAGIIWMNVGELTFDKTPELYYLRSTRKPEEILGPQQLLDYGIGYDALARHAEIKPAPGPDEKRVLFDDFIKYKESRKLYSQSVGDIDAGPENGGQSYSTVFAWSDQVPPGRYRVAVYAVRNGQVVATADSQVIVEETGVVKALADMAQENGALYGTAAIGVALTAGFGVGMVFRKGGGAH